MNPAPTIVGLVALAVIATFVTFLLLGRLYRRVGPNRALIV